MKHKSKWLVSLAAAAMLALSAGVFAACTDPEQPPEPTPGGDTVALQGISFAEDEISLEVGESVQLEVIFTPENATNKNVTWEVDFDDTCTVDENGLVTAKEDAAGKACTITATAEEGDGLYQAYCSISVIAARGEGIQKTAAVGTSTNTLTMYEYGDVELTGVAVSGSTELAIEPYTGSYQIVNNAPAFSGQVTAMGFSFPVLADAAFENQQLQLRLYINNGTSEFELGTYEFTKEEAAKLVGSTKVEGGIDTTVAYIQTTIAGANAADSIQLWSDGKAVFTVGSFVPAGSSVSPVSFETTWEAADNALTFAPVSGTVNTAGQMSGTVAFGDASSVAIQSETDTKNGVTVTVSFSWESAAAPVSATFNLAREVANSAFGFDIPYIETESITFAPSVVEQDGKKTLALNSGASLDLYATSTLSPAEGVTDLVSALTVGVALKEGSEEGVVTVSGSSVTGAKPGTATIVVTVDDITEEIEVTVAFPASVLTGSNAFAEDVTYSSEASGITTSFAFGADGTFYFTASAFGLTLFSSYGYYNITDGAMEVQYFNTAVALLYGGNLFTGVASYEAVTDGNTVASFTIVTTDGTTGEPVESVFTPAG